MSNEIEEIRERLSDDEIASVSAYEEDRCDDCGVHPVRDALADLRTLAAEVERLSAIVDAIGAVAAEVEDFISARSTIECGDGLPHNDDEAIALGERWQALCREHGLGYHAPRESK